MAEADGTTVVAHLLLGLGHRRRAAQVLGRVQAVLTSADMGDGRALPGIASTRAQVIAAFVDDPGGLEELIVHGATLTTAEVIALTDLDRTDPREDGAVT